MKCWIAGASGLVGGELLKLLLADERVTEVISIARRKLSVDHPKLRQVVVNFGSLDKIELPAADVAFCCLGTTIKKAGSQEAFCKVDHDYVISYAKAARKRGIGAFLVISALGADPGSAIFYNRVKGEAEYDLKNLGFPSLTIVRPSLLLGERKEKRFGENLAIKLYPFYKSLMIGPLAKQRPIPVIKVAEALKNHGFLSAPGVHLVLNHEIL